MRRIPTHLLSLALAVCATASLHAGDPAVSDALPGELHAGGLADLQAILADMPRLGQEGMIADKIDEFASQGIPDPRSNIRHMAFGSLFGKPDGVTEGVVLGTSDLQIVPIVREVAAQSGVSLTESAYRGVTFVTGKLAEEPSRFGDPMENLMLIGGDKAGKYGATHMVVDTLQGRRPSYAATHDRSLTPGTYVTGRMTLSREVRRSLSGTPLEGLAHLTGGSAEMKRSGTKVVANVRAVATGSLKASIALGMLRRKIKEIAGQTTDAAARRLLLEQTSLSRSGPTIKIDVNSPRGDFEAGLIALQELLPPPSSSITTP